MNIFITGCSRGIGLALVKDLVQQESVGKVFACTHTGLKYQHEKIIELRFDLEDEGSFNVFDEISDPLHIVIHAAGYLKQSDFSLSDTALLQKTFQINFFGPYILSQRLLSKVPSGGQFISIGSMGGVQGSVKFPGLSAYSASKSALAVWTECMAEEFKEKGIHFNCLALGAVDTEMLKEAFPGYHAGTSAEEMAKYIRDFALNQGHLFNGKVIPVSNSTP